MDPAHKLLLPQLVVAFDNPLPSCQRLLIAGGRAPSDGWLRQAAEGRSLWCIDRGLDACHRLGMVPSHAFGDGDSASPEAWRWMEQQGVPVERYPAEKDFTDTQLALSYAAAQGDAFLLLTGCFGGRFDHLFSIAHSCAHAALPCCLSDERETLLLLRGGHSLRLSFLRDFPCPSTIPSAISLLPMTATCSGVSIDHVRWPLQNATLQQSCPNAVSNVPSGANESITVSLSEGILALYLCWKEN